MVRRDGGRAINATAAIFALLAALILFAGLPQPAAIPLAMAAVVIAALQASLAPRPLLSGRLAQWLGDISYAVYLSHFFLWILFKLVLVDDPAMVAPAKVAAFVALTLAVSHLLHRWLEVPARRIVQRGGDALLSRLGSKRKPARADACPLRPPKGTIARPGRLTRHAVAACRPPPDPCRRQPARHPPRTDGIGLALSRRRGQGDPRPRRDRAPQRDRAAPRL
jgi:hypothetical protein